MLRITPDRDFGLVFAQFGLLRPPRPGWMDDHRRPEKGPPPRRAEADLPHSPD